MQTRCRYCRLEHPKVEEKGELHCPNPLCPGPGAAPHRSELSSFVETGEDGLEHVVDPLESMGVLFVRALETEEKKIIKAAMRSLEWWYKRLEFKKEPA